MSLIQPIRTLRRAGLEGQVLPEAGFPLITMLVRLNWIPWDHPLKLERYRED